MDAPKVTSLMRVDLGDDAIKAALTAYATRYLEQSGKSKDLDIKLEEIVIRQNGEVTSASLRFQSSPKKIVAASNNSLLSKTR